MKWVALALLVIGIALAIYSVTKFQSSSFEDGSFVLAILGVCIGVIAVIASLIWFGVLLFMGI